MPLSLNTINSLTSASLPLPDNQGVSTTKAVASPAARDSLSVEVLPEAPSGFMHWLRSIFGLNPPVEVKEEPKIEIDRDRHEKQFRETAKLLEHHQALLEDEFSPYDTEYQLEQAGIYFRLKQIDLGRELSALTHQQFHQITQVINDTTASLDASLKKQIEAGTKTRTLEIVMTASSAATVALTLTVVGVSFFTGGTALPVAAAILQAASYLKVASGVMAGTSTLAKGYFDHQLNKETASYLGKRYERSVSLEKSKDLLTELKQRSAAFNTSWQAVIEIETHKHNATKEE